MSKQVNKYRCDCCGIIYTEEELDKAGTLGLDAIDRLTERLDDNGPVPAGECPDEECGALVYLIDGTATVKVVRASILVHFQGGADIVFLETKLPPHMPKCSGQSPSLKFEVAAGMGIEYVRKFLGIEPEVIKTKD